MSAPEPIVVKAAEAAEMVRVSPDILKAAIRSGALTARTNGKGHYHIEVEDLRAWYRTWPLA